MHFGQVRVSDLLLVDANGRVLAGVGKVNPAGFTIHSQIHTALPDVVAAAHTHSTYGRAWSTLGRPLDPITQDACAFYTDHAVYVNATDGGNARSGQVWCYQPAPAGDTGILTLVYESPGPASLRVECFDGVTVVDVSLV